MAQPGTARHSLVQHGTARYGTAWYSTTQHNTTQLGLAQPSPARSAGLMPGGSAQPTQAGFPRCPPSASHTRHEFARPQHCCHLSAPPLEPPPRGQGRVTEVPSCVQSQASPRTPHGATPHPSGHRPLPSLPETPHGARGDTLHSTAHRDPTPRPNYPPTRSCRVQKTAPALQRGPTRGRPVPPRDPILSPLPTPRPPST